MHHSPPAHWVDFFSESDDSDDLAAAIRLAGLKDRFFAPDESILLTPVLLQTQVAEQAAAQLDRLLVLLCALPDILFDGDVAACLTAIGYSQAAVAVMVQRYSRPHPAQVLGRWDILDSTHGWKVLELNTGGAVAGLACPSVQELYDATGSVAGEREGDSPLSSLVHLLRRTLGAAIDSLPVIVVDDDGEYERSPFSADGAAQSLATVLRRPVAVCTASQLVEYTIDIRSQYAVFEIFTLRDVAAAVAADSGAYDLYLRELDAGRLLSINPLIGDVLMNKALLARLRMTADALQLAPDDVALVKSLVPEMLCLAPETLGLALSLPAHDWVLKPALGFGGTGVSCGWEMPLLQWQQRLRQVVDEAQPHILQRRVRGREMPIVAMTPKGVLIERATAPVLGIFTSQGRYCGGLARAAITASAVVNAKNQAAVGVLRLLGST